MIHVIHNWSLTMLGTGRGLGAKLTFMVLIHSFTCEALIQLAACIRYHDSEEYS